MKRKVIKRLIEELRRSILNGLPHDLTFKPTMGMSKKAVKRLQESLNHSFHIWTSTWLLPNLDALLIATNCNKLVRS